jgi:DNA replication protein DnaC
MEAIKMLIHPTLDNLKALKLFAMAKALEEQLDTKDIHELTFEDRFGLLVDAELIARENKGLESRLKNAKLRLSACMEDIDLKASRGIDRSALVGLGSCDWLRKHQNIFVTGATGTGKTYMACAIAQKACRAGFTVIYQRATTLFHDLALAKADGRYHKVLAALAKKDLMIIDDFALAPLTNEERRDLLEIVEERYDRKSTLIVSQMPTDHWHEIIGDPTIADAILDRLIHNSHKLRLKTKESKRKEKSIEEGDIEL